MAIGEQQQFSPKQDRDFVVIGAGPAGLTAGYQLSTLGYRPTIVEQSDLVGGLSRTEQYKGYYFDMGGHRFYTKSGEVTKLWRDVMGDDFLERPRLSRIYYRRKFFDYPLKPLNALAGLGPIEAARILGSYARWKAFPHPVEATFEEWVTNRFGKRLFEIFFKSYTEKVWGISCDELRAEWAAQRIKDLSLGRAIASMFLKRKDTVRTLIDRFHYPRRGPGMLWNQVKERIEQYGGNVLLSTGVDRIYRDDRRVLGVSVKGPYSTQYIEGSDFISSMPVTELVKRFDPPAPDDLLTAASRLHYRDFLTVCLVVNRRSIFADNWIYVHEPGVQVARIQNYKNWSPEMVPDSSKSSLGLEYFCLEGDELWRRPDDELIELGTRELERIGLVQSQDVEDGCVFRVPKAYPVYDSEYRAYLERLKDYLGSFENLQTIGRNGLHRYNNQDHAMLTGMYAVRNAVNGEAIDLWTVNADEEYLEEVRLPDESAAREQGCITE